MLGFLYAIGAAVSWGVVYALDQKILGRESPMGYLFVNSLLTVVLLLPFVYTDWSAVKHNFTSGWTITALIIASVAFAALANFLIFSSIKILGAGTASVFEIAYPFFVVVFCFLFYKNSISWPFIVGAVFIFLGSAIIIRFA
jgi:drug/metabolite transporter (DMT)-like permease